MYINVFFLYSQLLYLKFSKILLFFKKYISNIHYFVIVFDNRNHRYPSSSVGVNSLRHLLWNFPSTLGGGTFFFINLYNFKIVSASILKDATNTIPILLLFFQYVKFDLYEHYLQNYIVHF